MPTVEFRPITRDNWEDAIKLDVKDDQRNFVAPNHYSLLEGFYHPEYNATPQGINVGETIVGFIMPIWAEPDDPRLDEGDEFQEGEIWILRYMIDAEHQGKGYGKAGMQKFLAWAKAQGKYTVVRLSYEPENAAAQALYESFGFVEEGINKDWGEMVAACQLD